MVRQGSAKPRTAVRIRYRPQKKTAIGGLFFVEAFSGGREGGGGNEAKALLRGCASEEAER